jgi:hypothetical protein
MGKKPGLGLAMLIVVGLPVAGCHGPTSVGPPQRAPWMPQPAPNSQAAQGGNSNLGQRPGSPAPFPTAGQPGGMNGGAAPASGQSTGAGSLPSAGAASGVRPAGLQPGDPMPLSSSTSMPPAPGSFGTPGSFGQPATATTSHYTTYPPMPGPSDASQPIGLGGAGVQPTPSPWPH